MLAPVQKAALLLCLMLTVWAVGLAFVADLRAKRAEDALLAVMRR